MMTVPLGRSLEYWHNPPQQLEGLLKETCILRLLKEVENEAIENVRKQVYLPQEGIFKD